MCTRAQRWLLPSLALVFAALLLVPNRAVADDDDPPSRVARLSYSKGDVSFSPSGTDDWVSAVLNRPLTIGDKLWTDKNARAELQAGSAVLYLSGETGFSFLNLDDHIMQVRLTEGTLNLRVRRLGEDESIEVDTPNLAFSVLRAGSYRINVNESGDTTVINVREGQGEVTGGGSAYTVHPDEQGYFTGTDSLSADIQPLPDEDEFDHWCQERELRAEHAPARRYVSDDVIGYEDLDDYGGWRPEPEYGTVWFPHTTVVGWAPYRFGHWVWISPWGWTWVDDEPWGFAPFHYGRWVFVRGAWGWVPCPPRAVAVAYVRPVYAPALVAWVGGPHFGVGVAVGGGVGVGVNVGWFPLGPREVYVPSYHVSRAYVNNVNISNTTVNQTVINNYYNTNVVNKNVTVNNTNVTNVRYVNQSVPGAVTATSGQTFTSARPVNSNLVAVDRRQIASAPVVVSAPAVTPPKQAFLGGGAVSNVRPPAALQTRQVVAKTAPPPAPLPFAQRQAAIQANQGRPISIAESRQLEMQRAHSNNVAPVRIAPAATVATPRVNNSVPNNADRPAQMQNNNNRPPAVNTQQQQNVHGAPPGNVQQMNPNNNRPANVPANAQQVNPSNQPGTVQQGNPNNRPANTPSNTPANSRVNQDRPPTARSVTSAPPTVNPQLEQKHEIQNQQLQQKQDQERQKLEQKQFSQQQKVQQQIEQQKANEAREQQLQQKQQQQLQQMEQKHNQQQQQLQQKQQVEHTQATRQPQATKQPQPQTQSKPPKTEDKPHR
jgi:hypothetical protein